MPRTARSQPAPEPPKKSVCVVEDQRPISKIFPRMKEPGNPNIPIRTVLYVEVGEMEAEDVRHVLKHINDKYLGNEHPTFVVPTRSGRVTNEIVFEGEFLRVVNEICEVKDGEIVLQGGAHEVEVLRRMI